MLDCKDCHNYYKNRQDDNGCEGEVGGCDDFMDEVDFSVADKD